jgi:hypothetical protein
MVAGAHLYTSIGTETSKRSSRNVAEQGLPSGEFPIRERNLVRYPLPSFWP